MNLESFVVECFRKRLTAELVAVSGKTDGGTRALFLF